MKTPKTTENPSPIEIHSQSDFVRWVMEESQERPVVVDFWAPWCAPCRTLAPVLENLAKGSQGRWLLAKINTDEHQQLALHFGIRSIPAVKAFRHGKVVDEFTGVLPPAKIKQWLDKLVPSEIDQWLQEANQLAAQKQIAAARTKYNAILAKKPLHPHALFGLARLEHAEGKKAEALRTLHQIQTSDDDLSQAVAQLKLTLQSDDVGDIESLRHQVAAHEQDVSARYQLAMALSVRGQQEEALQQLLDVVRRCRTSEQAEWRNKAREAMVGIFDAVGFQHPLSQQYRSLLARELHS